MTNKPICPFCEKAVGEHEADDCINHWIHALQMGYQKVACIRAAVEPNPFETREKPVVMKSHYIYLPAEKTEWELLNIEYCVKAYSGSLGYAIGLWQDGWRLWKSKDGWVISTIRIKEHGFEHVVALTPALAIGRAYILCEHEKKQ